MKSRLVAVGAALALAAATQCAVATADTEPTASTVSPTNRQQSAQSKPASAGGFVTSVPDSAGINDASCRPTGAVTEPVMLIHGTSDNASTWNELIPVLKSAGMCVWAFDYGADDVTLQNAIPSMKGIGDIRDSATEVAEQIRYVRQATGAQKVNLVGHSQGGLLTKFFTEVDGGADEVARVVTVGANFHGTTLNGAGPTLLALVKAMPQLARFLASTAAVEQLAGSEFMAKVNQFKDTSAGVSYTSIYSPADVTVTPNDASILTAVPGADVVHVDLKEVCGASVAHPDLPSDRVSMSQILWGLQRGPGEQPDPASCGDLGLEFYGS